jgi:hypothetical protein
MDQLAGKLRKLLLVALSSQQDGEIVAAIRAVNKLLKKGGKDIHWLVEQIDGHAVKPLTLFDPGPYEEADWRTMLDRVSRSQPTLLSERECEFILSLTDQWISRGERWRPSTKQRQWLTAIYLRVMRRSSHG